VIDFKEFMENINLNLDYQSSLYRYHITNK